MRSQLCPAPTRGSPGSILRWKLAEWILAAGTIALLGTLRAASAALAGALLLVWTSRLPLGWYSRRLAPLGLVVVAVVLTLPFLSPGADFLLVLGPIGFSPAGLRLALLFACKGLALVSLLLVLIGTAPLEDIWRAAHALHFPGLFIQLTAMTYRYLFLLAAEPAQLPVRAPRPGLSPALQSAQLPDGRPRDRYAAGAEPRPGGARQSGDALPRLRRSVSRAHQLSDPRGGRVRLCAGPAVRARLARLGLSTSRMNSVADSPSSTGREAGQVDAIRVCGLTYRYPNGPLALGEINLAIQPGESVALVGPNGAGKTTLFLCLSGVLAVRPGAVQIMDLDPARLPERRLLPSHLGILFQNPDDQLFNSSVLDDVAFGPLNLGLLPEEVRARSPKRWRRWAWPVPNNGCRFICREARNDGSHWPASWRCGRTFC